MIYYIFQQLYIKLQSKLKHFYSRRLMQFYYQQQHCKMCQHKIQQWGIIGDCFLNKNQILYFIQFSIAQLESFFFEVIIILRQCIIQLYFIISNLNIFSWDSQEKQTCKKLLSFVKFGKQFTNKVCFLLNNLVQKSKIYLFFCFSFFSFQFVSICDFFHVFFIKSEVYDHKQHKIYFGFSFKDQNNLKLKKKKSTT
eukprot:TRINITY_DN8965_c0_g2_i6.p3 TRINITY_DN8965_c0_g2~~TRINITY_DN8965_c0_g2_i6.p3  ORF type:complete len:196 (-),score=-13.37 TRINITY_DN8965_c0_g2_i6:684-1271(-)